MIAVDTSALMAIALREAPAQACMASLLADDDLTISAVTFAEAPIVAAGGGVGPKCHGFSLASFNVAALTKASAERIADIYQRWGKGFHPAHLNFGDCFSHAVAQQFGCSLLYVGNDFARTDVQSAL